MDAEIMLYSSLGNSQNSVNKIFHTILKHGLVNSFPEGFLLFYVLSW
jgi:hypothetical protein